MGSFLSGFLLSKLYHERIFNGITIPNNFFCLYLLFSNGIPDFLPSIMILCIQPNDSPETLEYIFSTKKALFQTDWFKKGL